MEAFRILWKLLECFCYRFQNSEEKERLILSQGFHVGYRFKTTLKRAIDVGGPLVHVSDRCVPLSSDELNFRSWTLRPKTSPALLNLMDRTERYFYAASHTKESKGPHKWVFISQQNIEWNCLFDFNFIFRYVRHKSDITVYMSTFSLDFYTVLKFLNSR